MSTKFAHVIKRSYDASTTPTYVERLCTSWLLTPIWLFALRALLAIYAFVVLFFSIGYETTHGETWAAQNEFSYFTVLGYWGLAFYFSFAAAHTASYAFRRRAWLQSWPIWLVWLHGAFYATITVYPWVVTAVFWAVLSNGAYATPFSTWSNISEHALNSVFASLEILLPRSEPHPWIQLLPFIVILALYLGLAYLTHTTEHLYVYAFLDPANGRGLVAGACIGVLVAMIVAFVLVRYLIWLRRWVTEDKLGLNGKLSNRARSSRGVDLEHNGVGITQVPKSVERPDGIASDSRQRIDV